ncbi:MAG: hypothetical protein HOP24_07175 [Sideroxydans sp.]|nr:hypothetical protein [Sideroxydans sp.]
MNLTDRFALSVWALFGLWLILRLPFVTRMSVTQRTATLLLGYVIAMVPVAGLSLAGALRGMLGDLSTTSTLLLSAALFTRLRFLVNGNAAPLWNARERFSVLLFISVLALLLYPFALGIGTLDPYRAGFGSVSLLLMLALLSLWFMRRGLYLLPFVCALSVMAWSMRLLESTNLWDYLLDAPLAIYAIVQTVKAMLEARKVERV